MTEAKIERVYCEHVVGGLDYDDSVKKSFAEIVDKDSPGKSFGFSEEILKMSCLDLDEIEMSKSGDNDKTMDCSVGIGKFNEKKRTYAATKLLLVELKLNCKKHNLKQEHYCGKIAHTRNMLSGTPLHSENIFLFTSAVKGRAIREVFSWSQGSNGSVLKKVHIMSPEEFNDFIGFESQYPYKPINDEARIIAEIKGSFEESIDKLASTIDDWKDKGQTYIHRNNRQEASHIFKHLKSTLSSIVDKIEAEDDREYILLKIDELP